MTRFWSVSAAFCLALFLAPGAMSEKFRAEIEGMPCRLDLIITGKGRVNVRRSSLQCKTNQRVSVPAAVVINHKTENVFELELIATRRKTLLISATLRPRQDPEKIKTGSPVCTVSRPNKDQPGKNGGKRCQFPFNWKGKTYDECMEKDGKTMCPTKIRKDGSPRKWGVCGRCSEAAVETENYYWECQFEKKTNLTRGAASASFQKWANNIVPYQFDPSFTSIDRQTFLAAAQQIAAASCVSFIESSASQYLYVTRQCACGGSCFSGGFTDGLGAASPRRLVIGSPCLSPASQSSVGFVAHEILHALGIVHTQTRPDRNSHITVNVNNIVSGASQFSRCPGCDTYGVPYDCRSIMHYRAFFFSQGCSFSQQQTCSMTAKDPSSCNLFSSANTLTNSDKDLINKIYNCETPTPAPPPTPSPTPTPTPSPPTNSCQGSCGGKAAAGCWCDATCSKFGDCCSDKEQVCSPTTPAPTTTPATTPAPTSSLTCKNNCGSKVTLKGKSCFCDSFCIYWGDCCKDKSVYC